MPTIQQVTAIAVGKIAAFSSETAELVMKANLLPIMISSTGMETVGPFIVLLFYRDFIKDQL